MRQGDGAGHGRGRISGHLTMLAAAVAPAALGVLTASLVATAAPGATLTLSPDHGAAGASFSGTWQYAANRCPVRASSPNETSCARSPTVATPRTPRCAR